MRQSFLSILALFLLVSQTTSMSAQEKEGAEIKITISPEDVNTTVTHEGTIYMWPKKKLDISVELNEKEKISRINTAKISFNSDERDLATTLNDYRAAFELIEFTSETPNTEYSIQVAIDYSIILKSSAGEDSTVSRSSRYAHNEKVKVLEEPKASWNDPSISGKYFYHGTHIGLKVDISGGYKEGWKVKWPSGESTTSTEYTYTTKAEGTQELDGSFKNAFTIVATNYAPNGQRWYEGEMPVVLYTYRTPTADIQKKEYSIQESESFEVSPTIEGGNPATWTYKWYKNNELIAETEKLQITGVNKGTSSRKDQYKLVVTNGLTNEADDDFKKEIEFSVTVAPIVFQWKDNLPKDVVEGDEFTAAITRTGGDLHSWVYTWFDEDNKQTGNEIFTVEAKNGTPNGRSTQLKFKAECEGFSQTIQHNYVVWSYPSAQKESLDNIALLHGQNYVFSISTEGGLPSGWSYEWFLDGNKINGANSNSYNALMQNSTNDVKNCTYKVVAQNTTNNITRKFEFEFNAEIWPAASETHSVENQDLFYGSDMTLAINVSGGHSGNWSYEWSIDGSIVSDIPSYTYYAEYDEKPSKTETIKLKVKNVHSLAPKNEPLFEKEITFKLTSWSHGEITNLTYNETDYRSGDKIPVQVHTSGGYPNWTYYWYYNGELIKKTSSSTYSFTAENNYDDTYTIDKISVTAESKIPQSGASKYHDAEKDFTIWPVVDFADDFSLNTVKGDKNTYYIREGNPLTLSVDYATGGYNANDDKNWTYHWYENNNIVKNSNSADKNYYTIKAVPISGSKTKSVIEKRYKLYMYNESPYNSLWYEKTYETKVLKIHSRPQTPEKLVVKGNGSSNTLICMMKQQDDELSGAEYSFVFGYTDMSGKNHAMSPTKNRWFQFPSDISIKNSRYTFWVYTRWDYDESTYVTSGLRYLNGDFDESFDASCYNNVDVPTRGVVGEEETTDIDDVECDELLFNGTELVANTNVAVKGVVRILSFEGKCLDVIELGKKQDFNERIDLSGYRPGMYIISVEIGEMLVNKKVLVQ